MFVIYQLETDKIGRVTEILFHPTSEQLGNPNGVDLGDAPMIYPDNIPGMVSVLKIHLDSGLFYDYYVVDSLESKVTTLQQENAELNKTIGNLILESANDKATIASLEDTVGSLLLEVAALKGGAV